MDLFETHCHLNYDYSPRSIEEVLASARAVGVTRVVTVATDTAVLPALRELTTRFEDLYYTAGIHPHEAGQAVLRIRDEIAILRESFEDPKCLAVGELGLDTYYQHSSLSHQLTVLKAQLDLALEVKRPIIVHSRDAEPELLAELKRFSSQWSESRPPGVIHCFTGTPEFGRECLDVGFFLSFSGILTFKNAESLRVIAGEVPLERILIETDSPYLAPVPYRGKKAEPSMVLKVAEKLAEIRQIPVETVASVTTANAFRFFGLSPKI